MPGFSNNSADPTITFEMFTESHYGWDWKGVLEVILPNLTAQAGLPRISCSEPCPDGMLFLS